LISTRLSLAFVYISATAEPTRFSLPHQSYWDMRFYSAFTTSSIKSASIYIKISSVYYTFFHNIARLLIMFFNQLHSFLFSRIFMAGQSQYVYMYMQEYIGNFLDFAIAICCNDNRLSACIALPQVSAIGTSDSAGECSLLLALWNVWQAGLIRIAIDQKF